MKANHVCLFNLMPLGTNASSSYFQSFFSLFREIFHLSRGTGIETILFIHLVQLGCEFLYDSYFTCTGIKTVLFIFLSGSLFCSSRFAIAVVGFFGFVNLYALRVNMSVAMVSQRQSSV